MRFSLILACFYSAIACGEDPSNIPAAENFLRRIGPSVAVLGDYLYIEGGTITQLVDGEANTSSLTSVDETLSMSLIGPWTNGSPPLTVISKAAPTFLQPALWTDLHEQAFYMWGGQSTTPVPEQRRLWKFAANGRGVGNWFVIQPANPDVFAGIKRGRGASWTTCNGVGMALGGYGWAETDTDLSDHGRSDMLPLPGLLSYQLSTGTWANLSAEAFNGLGTSDKGSAVCLSSSGTRGMGILLPLGGFTPSLVTLKDESENRLDNLTFYDLGTGTWHWQYASGAIPPGRKAFCSVLLQGSNDTSEVYFYGGFDPITNATYGDTYVLSLPGFVWFKLSTSHEFPRWGHSCTVGGGSQMLVVGGQTIYPDGDQSLYDPDPWPQGIGVFDLQALDWTHSCQPNSIKYQTPQVVDDWYHDGGLERVIWSGQDTKALFIKTDNSTSSGNSSTTSNGDTDASPQTPTVATIVGAVLGTLLFLALVAGLFIFYHGQQSRQVRRPSLVKSPLKVLKVKTVRRIKNFNIFELSAETRPSELTSEKEPQELDSIQINKHLKLDLGRDRVAVSYL
ncbi:hypothetical protein F5Y09DRAFT_61266 [Xylaria sp. FL1042]|nr:hypothetical protein F5Y09DRAFT_61266 [Xylaria sp. FL1042]